MRIRRELVLCLAGVVGATAATAAVSFNRDVRPILSDKCFSCHGPDAKLKGVPFRLDREADAKAELASKRRAIVPGDPAASSLVDRVTTEKKALLMPPAATGHSLTAAEVETLRQWIAEGAKWEKHWAFLAPQRAELPRVVRADWARNPIDAFVLERLEREKLAPSKEATRETLIRRVSLDLTGLPPTPEETAAFVADQRPDAYERVVDRLLASPRYAERMAARWLDAARYADTNGYQFDGVRDMWRWRDWVIDAFHRNQPFDRFVTEQLAGDLLPGATRDQVIATGFNRNHRGNSEDGIVPEEYAVEYVVDRVETASTVFLGLTVGCARCHNHKYDPIAQREFYQLFAFFNNIPENGRAMKYGNSPPVIPAPTREQSARLSAMQQRIAALKATLKDATGEPKGMGPEDRWAPSAGLDMAAQFDNDDRFSLAGWFYSEGPLEGALVTRMQEREKGKGFGILANAGRLHVHLTSNYADDAIRMDSVDALAPGWHHVAMTYAGTRQASDTLVYVDGRRVEMKATQDTLYRPFRNAGSSFKEPLRIGAGGGAKREFHGKHRDVRAYARVLGEAEVAAMATRPLAELVGRQNLTAAERNAVRWAYLDAAPGRLGDARRELTALYLEREKLEHTFPTVMVMAENAKPTPAHILIRGAYDRPGEAVERGVPEVLPAFPANAPRNRLGLAQWLTDPKHPLLARVTVNRFWQSYFGTGLVKTVEDFGMQGEWPSHPELLDWLATEFIRTGWNVKAMQRLIVTSAAYRQDSASTPELNERDPDNRLLARGPRVRLAAEAIRDQALAAAGLLVEKVGGPSVYPYQPQDLWKGLVMQDMYYEQSKGADLYRRGLYTFWKRTVAPPMMVNFDAANREACVVRETRTNTPLQALNLMNDATFLEASRHIGQRMMEAGPDPAARLERGFRLVLGRAPTAREAEVLRRNLSYHVDYFGSEPGRAAKFLAVGESASGAGAELAAYSAVASLMLNLDEAVTKR